MVSNRRIGAEDSKSRTALLDATEQIMLEDGYAAVAPGASASGPTSSRSWSTTTSGPWTTSFSPHSDDAPRSVSAICPRR